MIKIEHREQFKDGFLVEETYVVGLVDVEGNWSGYKLSLSKEDILELKAELAKIEIK